MSTRQSSNVKGPARPSTKPQPVTIPPLAAAIAKLADPQADGLPEEFTRAYALMPALVAQIQAGDDDARWAVMRAVSGLEAAQRHAEQQIPHIPLAGGDQMALAVSVLNAHDPDLMTDLTTPIMEGAFFVGMAYACYMLSSGTK